MATNYPTSLDDGTSLPNPSASSAPNSPSHSTQHSTANDAIKALETKVGITSSTPASGKLLRGTGAGSSAWDKDAPTGTIVGTSDSQTLTNKVLTSPTINSPTITNATITADSITGYTSANTGTIYGISVTSGQHSASALTDGTVTPAKLTSGTGSSWAWQTWSPTLTNFTLGNGTLVSKYIQIGKTIHFRVSLILGSTSSVTGDVSISLPAATSASYVPTVYNQIGTASFNDNSAGGQIINGGLAWTSTTAANIIIFTATGTYVTEAVLSAAAPFAWATSDTMFLTATYEAA